MKVYKEFIFYPSEWKIVNCDHNTLNVTLDVGACQDQIDNSEAIEQAFDNGYDTGVKAGKDEANGVFEGEVALLEAEIDRLKDVIYELENPSE